jgi:hypothetical protein
MGGASSSAAYPMNGTFGSTKAGRTIWLPLTSYRNLPASNIDFF